MHDSCGSPAYTIGIVECAGYGLGIAAVPSISNSAIAWKRSTRPRSTLNLTLALLALQFAFGEASSKSMQSSARSPPESCTRHHHDELRR
jgi:hypothetical protein